MEFGSSCRRLQFGAAAEPQAPLTCRLQSLLARAVCEDATRWQALQVQPVPSNSLPACYWPVANDKGPPAGAAATAAAGAATTAAVRVPLRCVDANLPPKKQQQQQQHGTKKQLVQRSITEAFQVRKRKVLEEKRQQQQAAAGCGGGGGGQAAKRRRRRSVNC